MGQIKMESFEVETEAPKGWVDMTGLIGDYGDWNDDAKIMGPDFQELIAFRPGIRFLTMIGGDDDEGEDGHGEDEEEDAEMAAVWAMVPKVKALMDLLPKPQQTQLLYLEKMDRNT